MASSLDLWLLSVFEKSYSMLLKMLHLAWILWQQHHPVLCVAPCGGCVWGWGAREEGRRCAAADGGECRRGKTALVKLQLPFRRRSYEFTKIHCSVPAL